MKCPRCDHPNPSASWYCANCGEALPDLNVADSVAPARLPRLVRWSLVLSAVALVAVLLLAAALLAWPSLRQAAPPARTGPLATAATGAAAPTPAETSAAKPKEQPGLSPPAVSPPAVAGAQHATPLAQPRTRPGGPVWRCRRVTEAPVLDGWLDDWRGDPVEIAAIVFGKQFWDGPADLSGRAFSGWDEEALYIGARVTDDIFSQPGRGMELYLGDSLELQLDTDLEADWADDEYSEDDWQIGLSPGDFAGRPPEAYVWRPVPGALEGVRLASRRLEDGYIIEAAVPWASLQGDPERVSAVGLALNISDNDVPAPAQLSMVSNCPLRSWADPRSFGTLVLIGRR